MPPAVAALLATLAALLGALARAGQHSRCLARLACAAPSARNGYAAQLVRAWFAQPLAARLRRDFSRGDRGGNGNLAGRDGVRQAHNTSAQPCSVVLQKTSAVVAVRGGT